MYSYVYVPAALTMLAATREAITSRGNVSNGIPAHRASEAVV